MSEENVELLRGVYETPGDEAFGALLAIAADDVVWVSDPRMPGGGTFRGKNATSQYLDALGVFEQEALDVERVIDLGDRVLGITTIRAKPPDGPAVEWVWCQLVSFRDGLVTEVRNFLDRESALEAAGLSES
jgi:ketosteroid isomerase-like protein